jgi:MFS family permease
MFESFKYRDYRWLWIGSFANFMALGMQMMARGWLVLRLSNDSPLALSYVMIALSLPMTVISLLGGALADRISRKHVLIAVQAGNAVMTGLLATLDYTGCVQFWHLIAIGLVNGSLMAINMPSRQALVSDLVPPDKLMNAISLNNSGTNLTRTIGPALAGVLIVYIDTAGVFYLIAGCYVFSLLSLTMIRVEKQSTVANGKGIAKDIGEGLKYAAGDTTLRGLIITLFMPVFFGFSLIILLPAWGREALNVNADDLGLLMMVMGGGSLAGSLILAAARNLARRGRWLLINGFLWGCAMIFFSQSKSYTMALPFLFLVGFMNAFFMALNMSLMQIYATDEMRGRVMSIAMMSFGAMPLSVLPFGALAEWIGTPNALCVSGAMLAVLTVAFAMANPGFRKIE